MDTVVKPRYDVGSFKKIRIFHKLDPAADEMCASGRLKVRAC